MGGMCSWKGEYDRCPLQPLQVLQKRLSPSGPRTLDADVIGGNIEIILAAAGRKNKPTGYNGVKHPSMFYTSSSLTFSNSPQ
jgi:hypothetical protein